MAHWAKLAAKFAAGAIAGLLVWYLLTPTYNRVIAGSAALLLRADTRLGGVDVTTVGDGIMRFRPREPRAPVSNSRLTLLTYNISLLFAFFAAATPGWYRRRALKAVAAAIATLFATHVLAVVATVQAKLSTRYGVWSSSNYSEIEQLIWTRADYLYKLSLMFVFAFVIWWVANEWIEEHAAAPAREPKKRKGKRG